MNYPHESWNALLLFVSNVTLTTKIIMAFFIHTDFDWQYLFKKSAQWLIERKRSGIEFLWLLRSLLGSFRVTLNNKKSIRETYVTLWRKKMADRAECESFVWDVFTKMHYALSWFITVVLSTHWTFFSENESNCKIFCLFVLFRTPDGAAVFCLPFLPHQLINTTFSVKVTLC